MVSFQKAFWSKIAVAGHGTRYLFRLTFSRIISIFAILLSQCLFAKRIEKKQPYITQSIVCQLSQFCKPTVCSAGFCYCLLLLTPNYQWIQVEWSGAFSKHPKEATLWRELRKYVFSPSGAVRDKNPLWAWAVIFVTSAHARPDVRNFLTSGNGCFKSPSFPYHVTKKRRALGTRMAASIIDNGFISLLWQLRCHCNPDHNKFSSLSITTVVAIFPNVCLSPRSLCSNLAGIDPEKLYRAISYATRPKLLHRPTFLFDCFVKIWANCKLFLANGLLPLLAKRFPHAYVNNWAYRPINVLLNSKMFYKTLQLDHPRLQIYSFQRIEGNRSIT